LAERSASRLLQLNGTSGVINHGSFEDILDLVKAQDLIVFNNTKVIPARAFGQKLSGGKVEILIERILSDTEAIAHIKASNKTKPDTIIEFEPGIQVKVTGRKDDFYLLESLSGNLLELLKKFGHMPLPPYIDRPDDERDQERYQTVYAEQEGAVAAPTAGLHFTDEILEALKAKGVDTGFVTLHVGAGTFQPVRADDIADHKMHTEWFEIDQDLVQRIKDTKTKGGRIIAVGTTSVRTLESACRSGELTAMSGDTDIFIYPGYKFNVVDAMITNFHLPESTLIMLVSAFAGQENIKHAYKEAVENNYRFFSYGDAMFLTASGEIDEI